ncbi:MAG: T9SS type A sorting domain-containing protein [Bacteroidales bacterium]|nr:T9SS type A sorting domain-containing protein [Bacteroidales bacterium]
MKKILLFVVSVLVAATMFAQGAAKSEIQCMDKSARIERGTRSASEWGTFTNFTATDMNGNSHNIQNYLDQGKYVVIDFFCAWCNPCYSFHQTRTLENLYNTYGQGGTNEFVVLYIEGETTNTAAQITGTSTANTYAGASAGDFTNGGTNPIPIIDATTDLVYNVSIYDGYVPRVYLFCPSGYVYQMYGVVSNSAQAYYNFATSSCPSENDLPQVEINAPERVVLGESASVSPSVVSVSDIVSYQWSFGDGTPALATSRTANVTWNTLGTKTINVTVTNEYGAATATKNIEVYDCSTAVIDEFPFTENFEQGQGCWNFSSADDANDELLGVLEYDDGMFGAVFNSYYRASDYNQYMISPELDHIGTLTLTFKYKKGNSNSTGEKFYVKYSTTDNQISSFVTLGSMITANSTNWQTYTGTLPANAKYLMINYNTNYQYYLFVDDLSLTETIPNYTITATPDEEEHGSVTGSGSYPMLTVVTLTATPAEGYIFEKWSDDDATNPRVITVTSDVTLTANFVESATATTHTLTLNVDENCADMGSVAGAGTYVENANVNISAIPNTGYHFTAWNDDNTDNPRTVAMDADKEFTASFAINTYEITVVSANENQGTVAGTDTYNYNAVAEISATPAAHYHFLYWNDGNTENPRNVTVTENATYTAYFAVDQYTVTVAADDPSHGSVTGAGQYLYNTNAIVYAVANEGFVFSSWSDNNTDNPRTAVIVSDTTFTANFVQAYHLSVVSADPTMGRVSGEGYYVSGTEVEISALPFEHYHFVSWNDDNTDATRTITVTEDVTYTATFAPDRYTITVLSADESMGTVSEGGEYDYNEVIQISATPADGYVFARWNDQNTDNPRSITVVANATYTAEFAPEGAVDEISSISVNIFPNPTTGIVNIEAEGLNNVVVYDVTGRMMMSVANESTIDISNLEAGVYFFSVETANGSAMKKLVKE